MRIVKPNSIVLMTMTLVNDGLFVFPGDEEVKLKPVIKPALNNRFQDMFDAIMRGSLKQSPTYYTNILNK